MLKVRIKNFQSIGDCSIDIEGFTVVVGKNNHGKSALIRAIDAALSNRTGDEFIRWGKTKAEVFLEKDNLRVEWVRGSKAAYKVNDVPFTALRGAVPQPILDAGIRKMEIGNDKVNPLIAHQFRELFLINESGPAVTDILSKMYKLNAISDADEMCQKDLRADKSLLKTRESDLAQIQSELKQFETLEDVKTGLQEIKNLEAAAAGLQNKIQEISDYENRVRTLGFSIKLLGKIKGVQIPTVDTAQELVEKMAWFEEKTIALQAQLTTVKKLGAITAIEIPDVASIEKTVQDFVWLEMTTDMFQEKVQTVKDLEAVSKMEVPDYASAQALITALEETEKYTGQLKSTARSMRALKQAVGSLAAVDEITSTLKAVEGKITESVKIAELHDSLLTIAGTVKDLGKQKDEITKQLDSVNQEYSQFTLCPACGKPL